jgi:FkbM family methyltransferase
MRQLGFRSTAEASLFFFGLKKTMIVKYKIPPLKLKIDAGNPFFWKLLEKGKWDTNLTEFVQDLVKPGETILDIGAWEGPLSFLFSHLVGEIGRVYSFEPMPQSFAVFKHLVRVNNIQNIFPFQLAMSNTSGTSVLTSDAPGSSGATIQDLNNTIGRDVKRFKTVNSCQTMTVDDFCTSHNIAPSGLKIDVEGAEYKVFEGALKTIECYHPWCILEFHGQYLANFERELIWSFITRRAKKIIFLLGEDERLSAKSEVPQRYRPDRNTRSLFCIYF